MLAIKKRVNLEFLGEEFKEAYIIFQAIPLKDYEEILNSPDEGIDALKQIRDTLDKYFISGKVPNDKGELGDMKKEELGELDGDAATNCFQVLSGQSAGSQTDPLASKSDSQSKTEAPVSK